MIIDTTSEVVNTTSLTTSDFSITDSPMLYKLLYTSLYEDKEKIVLQELSANALDAHNAAGVKDTPIEIVLPSKLQPELIVRDFGIGMSLETLSSIYPVYGASTKRTNNTDIGGFGLGSKSPFSLSDTFIVESTHKGITTTVSCFLDNGQPKFSVFTSADIDKADGTEIRVPINDQAKCDRLSAVAATLFMLWPIKPKVTGVAILQDTIIEELDQMYVIPYSSLHYSDRQKRQIAVGPFVYALPVGIQDRLRARLTEKSTEMWDKWCNMSQLHFRAKDTTLRVIPKFDIGELELSPSREMIETTDKNLEVLIKKILTIISSAFEGAKSSYTLEWYNRFLDVTEKHGIFHSDGSSGIKTFLALDRKYSEPLMKELVAGDTSAFNQAWAERYLIDNSVLEEELLTLPPNATADMQDRLRHYGRFTVSSYNVKLSSYASLASNRICFLNTQLIAALGTDNVVNAYIQRDNPCMSQVKESRNGKPGLHTSSHYLNEDPRTIKVYVGDVGNRQKFYHWWRATGIASDTTSLLVFHREEEFKKTVAWLDEYVPLHESSKINHKVFTIDDVNKEWALRPKQVKTSTTSSSAKAKVKQDTDDIVIGFYLVLGNQPKQVTFAELKDLVSNNIKMLHVTSCVNTKRGYPDDVRILSKETLEKYPVLEAPRKILNRKFMRDWLAQLESTQSVKLIELRSMTFHGAMGEIRKDDTVIKDLESSKYNATLLSFLASGLSTDSVKALCEGPYHKLVRKSKDGTVIPFDYSTYRYLASYSKRRKFWDSLPETLLAKVLLIAHKAEHNSEICNILKPSDLKQVLNSFTLVTSGGENDSTYKNV